MNFTGVSPGAGANYAIPGRSGGTTAGVYNHQVYLDSSKYGNYVDQEATKLIDSLGDPDGGGTGAARWAYAMTFCADLKEYVYTNDWVERYIYKPALAPIGNGNIAMGDIKAADLRRLWDQYSSYGLGSSYTLGATTYDVNQTAAAFQAAVWEIIYQAGTTYDVTAGTTTITGGAWTTLANYWLTHLEANDPDIGLRVLVSDGRQDFAIIVPGIGRDPIPEPVTMAGLLLGIGGLGGYIRRRRRA
jgi:hypothetical protein